MKKNFLFLYVVIIFFSFIQNLVSLENKIEFKVNNNVITTIDINNEQ